MGGGGKKAREKHGVKDCLNYISALDLWARLECEFHASPHYSGESNPIHPLIGRKCGRIAGIRVRMRGVVGERVLTSDRNVCADFWAPTCSRYSYTYKANL